jgi:hypothetical protein
MNTLQSDLELTTLHIRRLEARLATQWAKVALMRAVGRQTDAEDETLREMRTSLDYLNDHLASISAPATRHKAS